MPSRYAKTGFGQVFRFSRVGAGAVYLDAVAVDVGEVGSGAESRNLTLSGPLALCVGV